MSRQDSRLASTSKPVHSVPLGLVLLSVVMKGCAFLLNYRLHYCNKLSLTMLLIDSGDFKLCILTPGSWPQLPIKYLIRLSTILLRTQQMYLWFRKSSGFSGKYLDPKAFQVRLEWNGSERTDCLDGSRKTGIVVLYEEIQNCSPTLYHIQTWASGRLRT